VTGGGGGGSVNIAFYPNDQAVDFNLEGGLFYVRGEARIKQTNLFLGASYRYSRITATRQGGPALLPDEKKSDIGGLGISAHWDGRDSIFSPTSGQDFTVAAMFHEPWLGGDTSWQQLGYKLRSYHPMFDRLVVGVRMDGKAVWNDVPFYNKPYVELRGVPAMRYQGDAAGEGEIEVLVRTWKRISVVGFFGLGWAAGDDVADNGPIVAGGGGIRYLLARQLGLQTGIDVARGPEETAFYIIVGAAWL